MGLATFTRLPLFRPCSTSKLSPNEKNQVYEGLNKSVCQCPTSTIKYSTNSIKTSHIAYSTATQHFFSEKKKRVIMGKTSVKAR